MQIIHRQLQHTCSSMLQPTVAQRVCRPERQCSSHTCRNTRSDGVLTWVDCRRDLASAARSRMRRASSLTLAAASSAPSSPARPAGTATSAHSRMSVGQSGTYPAAWSESVICCSCKHGTISYYIHTTARPLIHSNASKGKTNQPSHVIV